MIYQKWLYGVHMNKIDVIILAAGKGTRMNSSLPKVLHKLAGRTLLHHVISAVNCVSNCRIIVITGYRAEAVEKLHAQNNCIFVRQSEQLGTAHAVKMALPHIRDLSDVLILYGDVPLVSTSTIRKMIGAVKDGQIGLLTVEKDNPFGYGRIVSNEQGCIESIVEHNDATSDQLKITEVNTGVMAMNVSQLKKWIPKIRDDNRNNEYYLTDIIEIARLNRCAIRRIQPNSVIEVEGVNNREQLSRLERSYQKRLAYEFMLSGNSLADPSRFDQRGKLKTGIDNHIDVNCIFEGEVQLGNNITIGPNCYITNSIIDDYAEIKANSYVESSQIKSGATVGPFARLRPGTLIGEGSKVGNFVEIKKTTLGNGSKVNHLTYLGDTKIGSDANIGAGTITCNYDGSKKHETTIGENVFVGSNTTLVAPITLSNDSFVAAGSTVTNSVSEGQLAVGRAKQRNVTGWKPPAK